MRAFVSCLLLVAACSSGGGKQLELTMDFDASLSDATVARVTELVIHASGAQDGTFPLPLGRMALRSERVVYRATEPGALLVTVDANDATGALVATGSAGPVTLSSDHAVSLTVTLSAPSLSQPDLLPQGDLSGTPTSDMGGSDMPDMTAPVPPAFVNAALTTTDGGTTIAATVPTGTDTSQLLLAMVAGTNPTSSALPSFTAPTGWTPLSSTSSAASPAATASWFWRFGEGSSPASYTFARNVAGPTVALVQTYRQVTSAPGNEFDAPFTQSNPSEGAADLPSIHTNKDYELVVVNAFAPDDFNETYSNPPGLVARQTAVVLSADAVKVSHNDTGDNGTTLGAASRTLVLVTGLQPNP